MNRPFDSRITSWWKEQIKDAYRSGCISEDGKMWVKCKECRSENLQLIYKLYGFTRQKCNECGILLSELPAVFQ